MTEVAVEVGQVSLQRTVERPDTHAAASIPHSTVLCWVEAAEAELLERLCIVWLYDVTPPLRCEVDFLVRLWFRDPVRDQRARCRRRSVLGQL